MFWRITVPSTSGTSSPRRGPHPEDECTVALQVGSYSPNNNNNNMSHPRKLESSPLQFITIDEMTKSFKLDTKVKL
jgi:hypothetical protein